MLNVKLARHAINVISVRFVTLAKYAILVRGLAIAVIDVLHVMVLVRVVRFAILVVITAIHVKEHVNTVRPVILVMVVVNLVKNVILVAIFVILVREHVNPVSYVMLPVMPAIHAKVVILAKTVIHVRYASVRWLKSCLSLKNVGFVTPVKERGIEDFKTKI